MTQIPPFMKSLTRFHLIKSSKNGRKKKSSYHTNTAPPAGTYLPPKELSTEMELAVKFLRRAALNLKAFREIKNTYTYWKEIYLGVVESFLRPDFAGIVLYEVSLLSAQAEKLKQKTEYIMQLLYCVTLYT